MLKKILVSIFVLVAMSSCSNKEDVAKKKGFNDAAHMEAMNAKGFATYDDFLKEQLPKSGCDNLSELKHALDESGGDCNYLKKMRDQQESQVQKTAPVEIEYSEENCRKIGTKYYTRFTDEVSETLHVPVGTIEVLGAVWNGNGTIRCLMLVNIPQSTQHCSVGKIFSPDDGKSAYAAGTGFGSSVCYKLNN